MFPPWLLRRAGEMIPLDALHEVFSVTDTLDQFSTEVWTEKKQSHAEGKVSTSALLGQGRDILSLLRAFHPSLRYRDTLIRVVYFSR